MVDPYAALLVHLREPSALRTLLGGAYVFTPELPGNRAGNLKSVVFRNTGGNTEWQLRAQTLRLAFRCYGESAEEAYEVYGALYDRLHDTQNFIVDGVGFHGATEEVPGVPLEDPTTNWSFVFSVYSLRVATIPVSGGAGS
jgi:hypothetical protein